MFKKLSGNNDLIGVNVISFRYVCSIYHLPSIIVNFFLFLMYGFVLFYVCLSFLIHVLYSILLV